SFAPSTSGPRPKRSFGTEDEVGAGVGGAGVGVGGSGVAVGAGGGVAATGVAVGAGVPVACGVLVGAGLGVEALEELALAVVLSTVKVAATTTELADCAVAVRPGLLAITSVAVTVCSPRDVLGTVIEVANRPLPLTVTVGTLAGLASHVSLSWVCGANPEPLTAIAWPTTPAPGARLIDGVLASIGVNGSATARRPSPAAIVSAQSNARRRRDLDGRPAGASWSGRIHRRPSQNDTGSLHSVARLARRAPWLCGPASRRVCSFVGRRSFRTARTPVLRSGGGSTRWTL